MVPPGRSVSRNIFLDEPLAEKEKAHGRPHDDTKAEFSEPAPELAPIKAELSAAADEWPGNFDEPALPSHKLQVIVVPLSGSACN